MEVEGRRARLSRGSLLAWALAAVVGAAVPGALAAAGTDGPTAVRGPVAETVRALHTRLVATHPAADTVHSGPVTEVRLRFSTEVQLGLSDLTLLGPDGVVRSLSDPDTVPGSGGTELNATLPEPLPTGSYTVEWRTAGPDSHVLEGAYDFRVEHRGPTDSTGSPATAESGAGPESEALVPVTDEGGGEGAETAGAGPTLFGVGVRWLFFASLVGMLGVCVFRLAVVPSLSARSEWSDARDWAIRRVTGLAWGVAAVAVVLVPLRFWAQATRVFGADGVTVQGALGLVGSSWGSAWLLQGAMVALFLMGLLLTGPDHGRRGWLVMLAAALGSTLVPALSGHAAGVEGYGVWPMVNDALHVSAAGTWMGGLAMVLLVGMGAAARAREASPGADAADRSEARDASVERSPGETDRGPPALARLVSAFSRVALASVAVLLATGVLNAVLQFGSVAEVLASGYGRVFLAKVTVVAAAVSLGFYNWRVVRPSLRDSPRPGLLRVPATLEIALGVVILLITAVLVVIPPPGT